MADGLHYVARMTRFDRFWEPLMITIAAAMIWIGTF